LSYFSSFGNFLHDSSPFAHCSEPTSQIYVNILRHMLSGTRTPYIFGRGWYYFNISSIGEKTLWQCSCLYYYCNVRVFWHSEHSEHANIKN